MHFSELSSLGVDTMLTTSSLLAMTNDELYNEYVTAINNKDLKVINTVRSIIADRYSIKALKQSHIDSWKNNKDIARFFRC